MKGSLIAGAVVGLVGVAAFGLIHALIIVPIWPSLLGGVPFGMVGGLAMGWALYELRASRVGASVSSGFAFGFLAWLTLVPMTAFGAVLRVTGVHGQDDWWELAAELGLAFGGGAVAGRAVGGRLRAAVALGAASVALALAMGGPIPVTNSARAASLFGAFGGLYPACGVALRTLTRALSRRSGGREEYLR